VCSAFGFWKFCGHKSCLRAQACARPTNDCYQAFWPLVPYEFKVTLHAAVEAAGAGLSEPEIAAAIERARARYRATQAPAEPEPRPIAAPAQPTPRVRVL
jgi:hypothetical protein